MNQALILHETFAILQFVGDAAWGIFPVFLFSVILAVLLRELRLDTLIHRAFTMRVAPSIAMATGIGAFTPFCSCTVIPVISGLLASGVPLAPIMAFWIASPTMDLEIFAVSVQILGWPLAIARLFATLTLSIGAGFITHALVRAGIVNQQNILRKVVSPSTSCCSTTPETVSAPAPKELALASVGAKSFSGRPLAVLQSPAASALAISTVELQTASSCCTSSATIAVRSSSSCCTPSSTVVAQGKSSCCSATPTVFDPNESWWVPIIAGARSIQFKPFGQQVLRQSWLLGRWMLMAFFIEALITRYIPSAVIAHIFGGKSPFSIPLAALIGIPVYVNSVSAWPIIGGLLAGGMRPGAAIAFLLAGPLTTFPAMVAVSNLVRWRIFFLYFGMSLIGAILIGYIVNFILP